MVKLILLGLLLGYMWGDLWRLMTVKLFKLEGRQKIKNYHFHHSLFGVLAIILSVFTLSFGFVDFSIVLFFFGIGGILEHRLKAGYFIFIESNEKMVIRLKNKKEYW